MSMSHSSRVRSPRPNLAGLQSRIAALQATNGRLTSELDTTQANYNRLHATASQLGGQVEACKRDNHRLARSLEEARGAVSGMQIEQERMRSRQGQLEQGLSRANNDLAALNTANQQLRREQQETDRRRRELESRFNAHEATVQEEIKCLRACDAALSEQIRQCDAAIDQLHAVTADLQQQQSRTVRMVGELSAYTGEVHRELRAFEQVVEDRHQEAQEALRRQHLSAAQARELALADRALINTQLTERFGLGTEIAALDQQLGTADRYGADSAQAALALYVTVSAAATQLRHRVQELAREQIVREARARHLIGQARDVLTHWERNALVAYYRGQELKTLLAVADGLDQSVTGLSGLTGLRDVTDRTADVLARSETLLADATKLAEALPELLDKHARRNRFLAAIEEGIVATLERQYPGTSIQVQRYAVEGGAPGHTLRYTATTGPRTVIVEIDLEGNAHFWWEGYPEKSHTRDAQELERALRQGRELDFQLNAPPAFRGEPKFDPPPDVLFLPDATGPSDVRPTSPPPSKPTDRDRRLNEENP